MLHIYGILYSTYCTIYIILLSACCAIYNIVYSSCCTIYSIVYSSCCTIYSIVYSSCSTIYSIRYSSWCSLYSIRYSSCSTIYSIRYSLCSTIYSILRQSMDNTYEGHGPVPGYNNNVAIFYIVYFIVFPFFFINIFLALIVVTFNEGGNKELIGFDLDKNQVSVVNNQMSN